MWIEYKWVTRVASDRNNTLTLVIIGAKNDLFEMSESDFSVWYELPLEAPVEAQNDFELYFCCLGVTSHDDVVMIHPSWIYVLVGLKKKSIVGVPIAKFRDITDHLDVLSQLGVSSDPDAKKFVDHKLYRNPNNVAAL